MGAKLLARRLARVSATKWRLSCSAISHLQRKWTANAMERRERIWHARAGGTVRAANRIFTREHQPGQCYPGWPRSSRRPIRDRRKWGGLRHRSDLVDYVSVARIIGGLECKTSPVWSTSIATRMYGLLLQSDGQHQRRLPRMRHAGPAEVGRHGLTRRRLFAMAIAISLLRCPTPAGLLIRDYRSLDELEGRCSGKFSDN